jgi:TonB family protein
MTAALPAGQANAVRMQESSIRRVATNKVLPDYPPGSIAAQRSGVAVAAIVSDTEGRVSSITVLESPDAAIGQAVRAALGQWKVPPTQVAGRPERIGLSGKITFYFRITNGRGRVFHPEEMPGGPKPEPLEGPPPMMPGARPGASPGSPPPPVVQHDAPAELEIGEAEFKALLASARPTVLDIRERDDFRRGHHDGAINIPRDEISIRAYVELDRARPVVIDCSRAETRDCHSAARTLLRGVKVSKVLILIP